MEHGQDETSQKKETIPTNSARPWIWQTASLLQGFRDMTNGPGMKPPKMTSQPACMEASKRSQVLAHTQLVVETEKQKEKKSPPHMHISKNYLPVFLPLPEIQDSDSSIKTNRLSLGG